MNESKKTLTFELNTVTLNVVRLNRDQLVEVIPFSNFYNDFLNPKVLSIEDSSYSYDSLLRFLTRTGERKILSLLTNKQDYTLIFSKKFKYGGIIEVTLYRNKNLANNEKYEIDYLTNVYTRSSLVKIINHKLISNENKNSYLLMIDLDNFKIMNDTFGHLIGDICLKTIANNLKSIFSNYVIGRYGGDEFVCFVDNVTDNELSDIIYKILNIQYVFEKMIKGSGKVTCSVGVSSKVNSRDNLSELINEADLALYHSKSLGKNVGSIYKGRTFKKSVAKKDNKIKKALKNNKNNLLKDDIKKKRLELTGFSIILLSILFGLGFVFDAIYNYQSQQETNKYISSIMENIGNDTSYRTRDYLDNKFQNLDYVASLTSMVDETNPTKFLEKYVDNVNSLNIVDNVGVLFENGNAYFSKDEIYSLSSTETANNIVLNRQYSIEKMTLVNRSECIVYGVPFSKVLKDSEEEIKIAGVICTQDVKLFNSDLLMLSKNNENYISFIKTDGNKIIEQYKEEQFSFLGTFENIYNCFDYYVNSSFTDDFIKNIYYSNSYLTSFNANKEKYYVYCASLNVSDWKIMVIVNNDYANQFFANVINLNKISFLVLLFIVTSFIILAMYIVNKLILDNFITSYIDQTTGGINEKRFYIDAKTLIKNDTTSYYIVYLNIIRFKYINEKIGSIEGDNLLKEINECISSLISEDELVARQYSDRFALLLKSDSQDLLISRVESILEQTNKKISYNIDLTFDIGIYNITKSNEPIWLCIDRARIASKNTSNNYKKYNIEIFDDDMSKKNEVETYIEQSQETALYEKKFEVYYQPIVDISSEKIACLEGLVRWNDEYKKDVDIQTFIHIFEENGFIVKLDLYVFESVCKFLSEFKEVNKIIPPVSINLSRKHFFIKNFFDEYLEIINKYNLKPSNFIFEITESIIFEESFNIVQNSINEIKKHGSKIAIDDFGSGFSNLSLLNKINFDVIKIDKSLVSSLKTNDESSKIILQNIISLANDLHKIIVVEGVEEKEQVSILKEMNVKCIQGYYFYKPMNRKDVESILSSGIKKGTTTKKE